MRFEDWVEKLDDEAKELGRNIIAHNKSLVNGHNGYQMHNMDGEVAKCNYFYRVFVFEAFCGKNFTAADYPLGDGRWTVAKQPCDMVFKQTIRK